MDVWYYAAVESAEFHARMKQAEIRELRAAKEALECLCAQGYHLKDRFRAVKKSWTSGWNGKGWLDMDDYLYHVGPLKGKEPPKMTNEELTEFRNRAAKYETNFQRYLSSPERAAKFIRNVENLELPYCKNLSECDITLEKHEEIPEEKCRACLIDWLNAPAEDKEVQGDA